MKDISPSGLAELLEEGFEGYIQFDGVVYGRINDVHPEEASGEFYRAQGRFILSASSSGRKGYDLRLDNMDKTISSLRFEKREEAKVGYSNDEKYGPVIVVPITLHKKASLQIEPRGEILF